MCEENPLVATLYNLKPAFQTQLRPLVGRLASAGVTANQVTVAAAGLSIMTGVALAGFGPANPWLFWLLAPVLLVRMALNAIDGMLAREHGQASRLGFFLNELGDVVSDLALTLPFALVAPFTTAGVVAFALAAIIAEFAGVLGIGLGAGRRYDGPLGKSDRALAIGLLGALVGSSISLPSIAAWIFPALALLAGFTAVNRVRRALNHVDH
jgi:CDP-diacylglycerol--glycerol-3-phosphate 3-phosphatidyltransferase